MTTYLDVDSWVLVEDSEDDVIDDHLVLHVFPSQLFEPVNKISELGIVL